MNDWFVNETDLDDRVAGIVAEDILKYLRNSVPDQMSHALFDMPRTTHNEPSCMKRFELAVIDGKFVLRRLENENE